MKGRFFYWCIKWRDLVEVSFKTMSRYICAYIISNLVFEKGKIDFFPFSKETRHAQKKICPSFSFLLQIFRVIKKS